MIPVYFSFFYFIFHNFKYALFARTASQSCISLGARDPPTWILLGTANRAQFEA